MSFIARLREDIENVRQHDPAARGAVEIALNYSGMHAIWVHRLTHKLWQKDETKALARTLSQFSDRCGDSPRRDHRPPFLH